MTETPDCPPRTTREKVLFGIAKAAAVFLFVSGALLTQQTYQHQGDALHISVAASTALASLVLAIVVFCHDAARNRSVRHAPRNTQ